MSAAANWSYTATATFWPLLSQADWDGAPTFGPPQAISCDYSSEAKAERDARGQEFVTKLTLYTEFATAKEGDRVLLGESAATDPIAAGALEVRLVRRDADTFDRVADDYRIVT